MASLPNSRTVTYEEWLRMPEVTDGIEEVVNGEIRIMAAPKLKHAKVVQGLYRLMLPQTNQHEVEIYIAQFDLVIRRHPLTARVPDLAVFQSDTIVERDGRVFSPPQLIVEVRSPANTPCEREEKLADYASLGVPEVWDVAPESRTVEVLYLEDGKLRCHAILTEGIVTPKYFPTVHIDGTQIWPD